MHAVQKQCITIFFPWSLIYSPYVIFDDEVFEQSVEDSMDTNCPLVSTDPF